MNEHILIVSVLGNENYQSL